MRAATPISPSATTLWGGTGIILASLPVLLVNLGRLVPGMDGFSDFLRHPIVYPLLAVTFFASLGLLAFGTRGESGIVGRSTVGRCALLLFGLNDAVPVAAGLLSPDPGESGLMIDLFYLATMWELVALVAAAVAATFVVRARVLRGFARWALVPVVVCNAAAMGLSYVPVLEVAVFSFGAFFLGHTLLVVAGFTYLLQGRSADLRRRWEILDEKW